MVNAGILALVCLALIEPVTEKLPDIRSLNGSFGSNLKGDNIWSNVISGILLEFTYS